MNHPPSRLWSARPVPEAARRRGNSAIDAKNTQAKTACHRGVVGVRPRTAKLTMAHLGKREKISPRPPPGRHGGPRAKTPHTTRATPPETHGGRTRRFGPRATILWPSAVTARLARRRPARRRRPAAASRSDKKDLSASVFDHGRKDRLNRIICTDQICLDRVGPYRRI